MCEEAGQGRRNRYDVKVRTCVFLSTKISGRRRSHFSCAVFLAMTAVCLRVRHCENFPACFFPSRAPRRTLVPLDTRLRRKFRLECWSVSYLKTFGYSSRTYLKTYRFSRKKASKIACSNSDSNITRAQDWCACTGIFLPIWASCEMNVSFDDSGHFGCGHC